MSTKSATDKPMSTIEADLWNALFEVAAVDARPDDPEAAEHTWELWRHRTIKSRFYAVRRRRNDESAAGITGVAGPLRKDELGTDLRDLEYRSDHPDMAWLQEAAEVFAVLKLTVKSH
jgi:hypothetical protein